MDDWLVESVKLTNEVHRIEKQIQNLFVFDNLIKAELKELKDQDRRRNEWIKGLARILNSNKNNLVKLQTKVIAGNQNQQNLNLRGEMSIFENTLNGIKRNILDDSNEATSEISLINDELSQFMTEYNDLLEDNNPLKDDKKKDNRSDDILRYGRIGKIESELAALGGRNGSWDSRDHDVFLRLWTRYVTNTNAIRTNDANNSSLCWSLPEKVFTSLVMKIIAEIPIVTEEEAKAHIAWYLDYLRLLQEKKDLIGIWKGGERGDRRGSGGGVSESGPPDYSSTTEPTEEPPFRGGVSEEERAQIRLRVVQWKEEKKQKQEEEKRTHMVREQLQAQKTLENKRRAEEQKHQVLERYREQVALEKDRLQAAKNLSQQRAARASESDKAEILERAQRAVGKAIDKRNAVEQKQKEKSGANKEASYQQWKASQVNSIVNRNMPSTLNRTTRAFENAQVSRDELLSMQERRSKSAAHSRGIAMGGYDLKFGGRAIPTWTQNIRQHL